MKRPVSLIENIDCLEGMKKYPDKFFELAIVDPPYGINIAKRNGSIGQKKGQGKITTYKSKDWDASIPEKDYFSELFRVSENQIVFGANYFTAHLPSSMGWIVYDKLQPEGVTFAMAELAFSSFDRSIKTFRTSRSKMQNCVSNNKEIGFVNAKIHPAQKPVALYKWLLSNYAKEGDKILDTHLGSGSSRIAAYIMGFDFYGFELDRDYYEAQEKRFKEQTAQQSLFGFDNTLNEAV
jgi:site-specific DNA-methyltransferase (adenine-specific)